MPTLEKPRTALQKLTRGIKLLCYNDSYDFHKGFCYRIYNIVDGDIIVMDRDHIQVIFSSESELYKVFKIKE